MKLQRQTIFGKNGNCLSACVATLFEIDLSEVPYFNERDDGSWYSLLVMWCSPRNLYPLHFGAKGKDLWGHWIARDQVVIVEGLSPRGNSHAVLFQNGQLYWDPHPEGGGISEIDTVWTFVVRDPARALKSPVPRLNEYLKLVSDRTNGYAPSEAEKVLADEIQRLRKIQ